MKLFNIHSTPKESTHFEFQHASTQNLGHVGPMASYGGQLIRVPHQTKLSSKVRKQSLKACALSSSNKKIYDKNRFLWTFWHDFPTNFSSELWEHLEVFHKPRLNFCRTLIVFFSNLLVVLLHVYFNTL